MIVRAREAEMQFLRQEASSLREELEVARMVPTVFCCFFVCFFTPRHSGKRHFLSILIEKHHMLGSILLKYMYFNNKEVHILLYC